MRDRGFVKAAKLDPWPRHQPFPDLEVVGREANGLELVLTQVRTNHTPIVLEIGAEFGGSTRRWLKELPDSLVVSIDPWLDTYPTPQWPHIGEVIASGGSMLGVFQAFCWPFRDRIAAIRGFSPDALVKLASVRLKPSIVYVDGDHRYESVLVDLGVAGSLWPTAILCGDDWNFSSKHSRYRGMDLPVRHAVRDYCQMMDHGVSSLHNTWLIDREGSFSETDQTVSHPRTPT